MIGFMYKESKEKKILAFIRQHLNNDYSSMVDNRKNDTLIFNYGIWFCFCLFFIDLKVKFTNTLSLEKHKIAFHPFFFTVDMFVAVIIHQNKNQIIISILGF